MDRRYMRSTRRVDARQTPARRSAAPNARAPRRGPYPQQHRYAVPRPYGQRTRSGIPIVGVLVALVALLLVIALSVFVRGCVAGFSGNGDPANSDATVAVIDATVADVAQEAKPVEIRLAMIGDILQHMGVYTSGIKDDGSYNFDHVFTHIKAALADQDIKVVNQETPLGGADLGYSGYPSFNGPQEMGDAEAAVGFNVVLRATNHTMDRGYEGLKNELAFWRSKHANEVEVIGAVDPDAAAAKTADPYKPYLFEKDGFTVALLNATYDLNGYEDPNEAVANLYNERLITAVRDIEDDADLTVIFPHWGTEYQLTSDDSQREMAKKLIDAGADAIIGAHPHVIEPFEVLSSSSGQKVPCFWSVGNYISTQIDNENLVGAMAKLVLRKETDGTAHAVTAEFWPIITHKGVGINMTSYLLSDWNEDLAASNGIDGHSYNPSLTVSWADRFCTEVLGDEYDANRHVLSVDLAA